LLAAVMEANVDGRPDLKGGQTRRFSRIVTTAMSTTTP
jgi:hypothetical protein